MNPSSASRVLAIVLLLVTAVYARDPSPVPTNASPEIGRVFSADLDSWRCAESHEPGYQDPNVDLAWAGQCREGDSVLDVYVGYLSEQKQGKRILSPKMNYPRGDRRWSYISSRTIDIPFVGDPPARFKANRTVLQHVTGQQEIVLYWYQRGAQSFGDEWLYRLDLMTQHLKRATTAGTVVRISAPAGRSKPEVVVAHEERLARALFPELMKHFL